MLSQVCVTFVFSALLEYALVNYASRSDAQRLAKKKHQKQWELDHCSFDPENMDDLPPGSGPPGMGMGMPGGSLGGSIGGGPSNNGGSFAMVRTSSVYHKHWDACP